MSTLGRAIEGVADAVAAAGEYVAAQLRPTPPPPPRPLTPSARKAVRKVAIAMRVKGKKRW
ncbi:hypothetical protein [Gemmata sp.]|uniref:hypothetical protein n=1 Tax=Gemmata sp. TaxID=1914242 RepID=UPI003F6E7A85